MDFTLTTFLEALLLVTALSVDAFAASFAYGTNRIHIPFSSAAIIDGICSSILVLFLLLGEIISPFIPAKLVTEFCFAILFFLGITKLFDSSLKILIRRFKLNASNYQFHLSDLKFILTIYADPKRANIDDGDTLSPSEAISLGLALSLDSAAAGFGSGFVSVNYGIIILLSIIAGAIAIVSGCCLGNHIAKKTRFDLSFISGALLIVLAFMKIW